MSLRGGVVIATIVALGAILVMPAPVGQLVGPRSSSGALPSGNAIGLRAAPPDRPESAIVSAPAVPRGLPLASPSTAAWFNETLNMSTGGGAPEVVDGGLAYDPLLDAMILYGGCGTVCPTNATWEYDGSGWQNITGALDREPGGLPPPLEGMGFAWDPQWGGVLLSGGSLSNRSVSDQTWVFNASGWTNETDKANGRSAPSGPDVAYGAMAYDGALRAMIEVNGCTVSADPCPAHLRGGTYALSGPGSEWTDLGSSFALGKAFPGSPSVGGWGSEMAYDPAVGKLVYFGGEDGRSAVQNATWVMNSTGWYNVSATTSGCQAGERLRQCFYPEGAAFGAMTWDGQSGSIVLVGGTNTTGMPTNRTFNLTGSGWFPACLSGCPVGSPPSEAGGEMASNSSEVAPLLVEGRCLTPCPGDSYVYEVPPTPSLALVAPNPTEVGVPVEITASNAPGTGSGPSLDEAILANGRPGLLTVSTSVNFTTPVSFGTRMTFLSSGPRSVAADEVDFFFVSGTTPTVTLGVNASLQASGLSAGPPNPTTATSVAFHLTVGDGVPPYSYAWRFGDGAGSTNASPTHRYGTEGSYPATVRVTDALGREVNLTLNLTVSNVPKASFWLSWLASGMALYLLLAGAAAVGIALGLALRRRPARPGPRHGAKGLGRSATPGQGPGWVGDS